MKLSCSLKPLREALGVVSRAVGARGTFPIIEHVLLDARADQLTLSATSQDLALTRTLAADVAEPGQATVPAKRLGGRRVGASGRATADVEAGHLVVECKERKTLPAWLVAAVGQATSAAGDGRLGIVVLHQLGSRRDSDIVCIRLRDWEEWYGALEREAKEGVKQC